MFGPCRDHILTSFTSKPVRPLQSWRLNQQGPRAYVRAMFGPCKTMFRLALLPDQPELWNFQDWVNMVCGPCLWSVYFLDYARTIFGPWWDLVWTTATSRPAISLNVSKLCQHDLRPLSMEFLLFGTMSKPCFDPVKIMFGIALLPDQVEVWYFKTESI